VELVAVEEGGGCLATFLLIATALVMAFEGVKWTLMRLGPYWPVIWSQLRFWAVVGLVLFVAYRCGRAVMALLERWDERLEVEAQTREAKAELRAIHRDAARQMERITRQRAGR
jgi:type VI protein secretion system component VasK